MQIIGKDTVIETYTGRGGEQLHRTTTGFQFGTGRDRKLVTGMDQMEPFHPDVKKDVSEWLAANGLHEARAALMDREVCEAANEAPGTLDAMAEKLGPDVKSQLFQMLKGALHQTGGASVPPSPARELPIEEDANGIRHILPDAELVEHPRVIPTEGGVLLDKGNGHKEFVLGEEMQDLEEERQAIAKQDGLTGAALAASGPSMKKPARRR